MKKKFGRNYLLIGLSLENKRKDSLEISISNSRIVLRKIKERKSLQKKLHLMLTKMRLKNFIKPRK